MRITIELEDGEIAPPQWPGRTELCGVSKLVLGYKYGLLPELGYRPPLPEMRTYGPLTWGEIRDGLNSLADVALLMMKAPETKRPAAG